MSNRPTNDPDAVASDLTVRNRELDADVQAAAKAKRAAAMTEALPRLADYAMPATYAAIQAVIAESGLGTDLVAIGAPTGKLPPGSPRVDVAFNTARASTAAGRNPRAAAASLVEALTDVPVVAAAWAVGPYVNIRLDEREFAGKVLTEVLQAGATYGRHRTEVPTFVVLDYSHPNIAKNMTVAHLRSTIIGHSLYKLHEACGDVSFSINHLGDWGTQFGKLLYEYRRAEQDDPVALADALAADPTGTLMQLYREFVAREDDDPAALDDARELFLRLERGDPELVALWADFRAWSMRDFDIVYERLRIEFDAFQGESFYEDKMAAAVDEALARGVVRRRADGAVVFPSQPLFDPMSGKWVTTAMLDAKGEPRDEIVLKPSGGTVYLTRDLAAIKYRTQVLGAQQLLYVIGKEQRIHCLVLFAMAEQMGYVERGQALHTSFGHLNFGGRKMRSRAGTVVLLGDLLDDAVAAARVLAESRGEAAGLSADERELVAQKVGIGSLIFNDLRQDRQGDIEFDPDVAGRLEAGQGPYVQYAYCRLRSISSKVVGGGTKIDVPAEVPPPDIELLRHLAAFPGIIGEAAARNAPHRVAGYVNQLAQLSNAFYVSRSVKDAPEKERDYLLSVVSATERVFEHAAELLHLELPERM